MFPSIPAGSYLPLYAPFAKPAGNDHPINPSELIAGSVLRNLFAVHPFDADMHSRGEPGVAQALHDGQVGIMELGVLTDNRYDHLAGSGLDSLHQLFPFPEVGGLCLQPQCLAHRLIQPFSMQHERCFVEAGQREVFDDAIGLNIAEEGDLFPHVVIEGPVGAGHDDARRNAHGAQLFHGVLSGLGLMLPSPAQKGTKVT